MLRSVSIRFYDALFIAISTELNHTINYHMT
jgi:hypothetical protein